MAVDMAMNASSTFVASFALVSMKGMPIWSANSCNRKKKQEEGWDVLVLGHEHYHSSNYKQNVKAIYLSCVIWDNSICCQITLVSNQKFVNIVTSITVNFTEPLLHIIEAIFICHVINNLQKETISEKCNEIEIPTKAGNLLCLKSYAKKIITHNDSMCSTIVATSYCPKSFLSSSIPLQRTDCKPK